MTGRAQRSQESHPHAEPEVYSITTARRGHREDLHDRFVKYTVSMLIRTACVLLAIFVPGPMRWVFVVGAVILPYVAVVLANAGRESMPRKPESMEQAQDIRALPAATGPVITPDEPLAGRPGPR